MNGPSGSEEHVEHAEHAHHGPFGAFDRRVALGIVIIAAALAGVTMVSHRAHNDTVRLQSEANIYHTQASDRWSVYEAKGIRSHDFQAFLMLASFTATEPGTETEREKALAYWSKQVDKYEGKITPDGKHGGDGELADLKRKAEALEKKAKGKQDASHHVHHNVNWLDFGHLSLEFALVLCSVALLTRQRMFWLSGIVVALLGVALALYGVNGLYFSRHTPEQENLPHVNSVRPRRVPELPPGLVAAATKCLCSGPKPAIERQFFTFHCLHDGSLLTQHLCPEAT